MSHFHSTFKMSNAFKRSVLCLSLSATMFLTACDGSWFNRDQEPQLDADQINKLIPTRVKDSQSWADDIFAISE